MTAKRLSLVDMVLLTQLVFMTSSAIGADENPIPRKNTHEASVYRGSIVYEKYCQKCHGKKYDGKGRAAKLYNPKPANLAISDKPAVYKKLIIRKGGAAVGRSEFMPAWGEELTDEQLSDVVNFLQSIGGQKK